jgi:uncharacterized membrane protein YagU involved in acid resistance
VRPMATSAARLSSALPVRVETPRLLRGAAGGLVGGIAFGLSMQVMGMLPMVAMLVGSTDPLVGWAVHLPLSIAFGAAFGALVAPNREAITVVLGLAWGVLLWAVAAMVVMRLALGAPIALDAMAGGSLLGHLLYGGLLGLVHAALPVKA